MQCRESNEINGEKIVLCLNAEKKIVCFDKEKIVDLRLSWETEKSLITKNHCPPPHVTNGLPLKF